MIITGFELPALRSVNERNAGAVVGRGEVAVAFPVEAQERGAFKFEFPTFRSNDVGRSVSEDRRAPAERNVPKRSVTVVVSNNAL